MSRSHVGRVRAINEDRVFDDAEAGVWAVADGMGGHSGGDLAAQQVVTCLRRATEITPLTQHAIRNALLAANGDIHARNKRLGLDAGTTVVTAVLADGWLEISWAGDSRAYRLRDGRAELLTHDHSLVQQFVDAGLLTPAQAETHPHANIVTRALGVDANPALDTVRVEVGADRFLLCSDGLSRSLRIDDFPAELPLAALGDRMIANALERDGSDNVSLVLIEIAAAG
ncbi:PP2C family protein-serine/threonine phosphatase [Sphingomonas sp.]|uniref:PP2C family protein-serine/threonine phosphatase n=1 Tax=Sphingomonas sp. TaxID=28214 RepID=UPI002D806B34|nr:protein phosphatase 2C domain-containing protein [Sphingomonas sp.]HEU0043932.1 protein phosphatase 2C domain-containing protein [Sphingomonas sp.]